MTMPPRYTTCDKWVPCQKPATCQGPGRLSIKAVHSTQEQNAAIRQFVGRPEAQMRPRSMLREHTVSFVEKANKAVNVSKAISSDSKPSPF